MKTLIEFLNDIFGINNDTTATIIITLIVFIFGYTLKVIYHFIKNIFRFISECKSRKHYKKMFHLMIEAIYTSCVKQSMAFSEFSKNLNIQNSDIPPLKPESIRLLHSFQKIPFETFYNSFFKGIENCRRAKKDSSLEHFKEIYSITEELSFSEYKYFEDFKDFNTRFEYYINQWNLSFGRIGLFIDNILDRAFKVLPIQQPNMFYFSLNQIRNDWKEEDNCNDYYIAHNKFLLQLISYLNNPENRFYIDEFRSISNDISEARRSYQNLDYVLKNYQGQFKHYGDSYALKAEILKNKLTLLIASSTLIPS